MLDLVDEPPLPFEDLHEQLLHHRHPLIRSLFSSSTIQTPPLESSTYTEREREVRKWMVEMRVVPPGQVEVV